MIKSLFLSEVAAKIGAELVGADAVFDRVSTDTRTVAPGDLFVALKGDNFDAHDFVVDAQKSGAVAAVVEKVLDDVTVPQLKVADTTRCLSDLARLNRSIYEGKLLALTGSCGKTTVKEMLSSILSLCGKVTATKGNLNNHIGAPLTALNIGENTDFAVIEMGASGLGEIDYLASMTQPDISLVNNVAAAHLEGFGSELGVAQEKSTIYHHLSDGGVAVINGDEPYAASWVEWLSQRRPDVDIVQFSCAGLDVDVQARDVRLMADGGYGFTLAAATESIDVRLPLLGRQNVSNAVAAAACALQAGATLLNVRDGLQRVRPVTGRMQPQRVTDQLLVLNDSYNANPASVEVAAAVLLDFMGQGKQVVMVLGGMAELGNDEILALQNLGAALQAMGLPILLTVSESTLPVVESFRKNMTSAQTVLNFRDKETVNRYLADQAWNNSVILVKGSRSSHMEEVVSSIIKSGEQQ